MNEAALAGALYYPDRKADPARPADLFMRLVQESMHRGPVEAIDFLLNEAEKWGAILEVRRPVLDEKD